MSVSLILGELRQTAQLSRPGVAVPDGDGGFTQTYVALDPPAWRCAIEKASVRAAERLFAGTIVSHATYIMTGRFHPGITNQTRVIWTDYANETHTGDVLDSNDTEGAGVETVILVSEIVS